MLNRIRRAVSLARGRRSPKGRHRRPLTRACSPARRAPSAPLEKQAVALGHALERARYRRSLRGGEVALVRPYILAWEQRVQHPVPVAAGRQVLAERHPVLWGVG